MDEPATRTRATRRTDEGYDLPPLDSPPRAPAALPTRNRTAFALD